MKAWLADTNVDIMSPQLYTSGYETAPEFALTYTCGTLAEPCSWQLFANAHPKFVPSIIDESHLQPTIDYFAGQGVPMTRSFFQWRQQCGSSYC